MSEKETKRRSEKGLNDKQKTMIEMIFFCYQNVTLVRPERSPDDGVKRRETKQKRNNEQMKKEATHHNPKSREYLFTEKGMNWVIDEKITFFGNFCPPVCCTKEFSFPLIMTFS